MFSLPPFNLYFEDVWIVPKGISISDAEVENVGYFLKWAQAVKPENKFEFVKPVPVVYPARGKNFTYEPRPGSQMIRFVTAKQIKMGPKQVHLIC